MPCSRSQRPDQPIVEGLAISLARRAAPLKFATPRADQRFEGFGPPFAPANGGRTSARPHLGDAGSRKEAPHATACWTAPIGRQRNHGPARRHPFSSIEPSIAREDSNADHVRRRAIFIIDADADARRNIETRLATLRLTNPMVGLADGEQALQALRHAAERGLAQVPALVVLDVELPGRSGLDVVRAMRETIGLEDVPVVILSAVDDAASVTEAYRLGVRSYLVKPTGFDALAVHPPRPPPALVVDVMILRLRSIPSWIWYLVFGTLCCGLFLTFDNGWAKAAVQVPVYAGSAVLLARTWWRRRATQPEPLLSLAVVAFAVYFGASIWGVILPLTATVTIRDGAFAARWPLPALLRAPRSSAVEDRKPVRRRAPTRHPRHPDRHRRDGAGVLDGPRQAAVRG